MAHSSSSQLQGWIDRMKAGDADARGELLSHACERLRRLTRKMLQGFPCVHDFEQTDDVLQKTALRLLRRLQAVQVATVHEFFQLAAREMRRELLSLVKRYRGKAPVTGAACNDQSTGNPRPGLPDVGESTLRPDRLALWTEFHGRVESLPPNERAVFNLIWYQGLTQADAAVLLRVPRASVQRRWLAARLRLQAALPAETFD
jgi:RNA polymerase sigma factor (sigma-70 family)